MKRYVAAIGVFFFVVLVVSSCREHASPASDKKPLPSPETQRVEKSIALNNSAACDSILGIVEALEDRVRADPGNGNAAQALAKAAFDSASGCFIAAGKGTFNRSHPPQAALEAGRTMAAQYDAKRWALYLKTRSLRRGTMFGQNIAGEITYSSTLCARNQGDTLVLLVKVPLGSVIVK